MSLSGVSSNALEMVRRVRWHKRWATRVYIVPSHKNERVKSMDFTLAPNASKKVKVVGADNAGNTAKFTSPSWTVVSGDVQVLAGTDDSHKVLQASGVEGTSVVECDVQSVDANGNAVVLKTTSNVVVSIPAATHVEIVEDLS